MSVDEPRPTQTISPPLRVIAIADAIAGLLPDIPNGKSTPPCVRSFTVSTSFGSSAEIVRVQPSSLASGNLLSMISMPMISDAPEIFAAITALSPTPPNPNTATLWPGRTFAALNTAPAPVTTAQPNIAATSSGIDESALTTVVGDVTAYYANDEMPL